jgi:dihydrofolate reductase
MGHLGILSHDIRGERRREVEGALRAGGGITYAPPERHMRKLIVSEFVSLDGVVQAPGGKDEDRDGGFELGGWTVPYWHDDIGNSFGAMMQNVDAFLLGRRTYEIHAQAFEPMPPGDPFGDLMNTPKKYVVSRTLQKPIWRNTTIIRDDVPEAIRALKAMPGRNIATDGSSELVRLLLEHDLVDELHLLLYPLTLGRGKRIWAEDAHIGFTLRSATPYPTGVVGLDYVRQR